MLADCKIQNCVLLQFRGNLYSNIFVVCFCKALHPGQQFSVILVWLLLFSKYQAMGMKCLAQGHNIGPRVRIEPPTLHSSVRGSPNRAIGVPYSNTFFLNFFNFRMSYLCCALLVSTKTLMSPAIQLWSISVTGTQHTL